MHPDKDATVTIEHNGHKITGTYEVCAGMMTVHASSGKAVSRAVSELAPPETRHKIARFILREMARAPA
jgi:hypothetical protein